MEIIFSKKQSHFNKLDKALVLHNYLTSKSEYLNPNIYNNKQKYNGFYLYDNKELIGGVGFYIDYYNWVFIEDLYINPSYRGQSYGTQLINKVKQFAKEHSCTGIRVETWDFQARPFYEKNGFTLYGELKNHPVGRIDYLLKIELLK